jgi:Fe-S-cluster containining protein
MKKLPQKELDQLIPSLCTRCGKCCLKESYMLSLNATGDDVRRWRNEGRADILRYAEVIGGKEPWADLWVKPESGEECTRCPFVRKDRGEPTYSCRIHSTRPQVCRNYPGSYDQMAKDGCEIIEELRKLDIDATGWEKG